MFSWVYLLKVSSVVGSVWNEEDTLRHLVAWTNSEYLVTASNKECMVVLSNNEYAVRYLMPRSSTYAWYLMPEIGADSLFFLKRGGPQGSLAQNHGFAKSTSFTLVNDHGQFLLSTWTQTNDSIKTRLNVDMLKPMRSRIFRTQDQQEALRCTQLAVLAMAHEAGKRDEIPQDVKQGTNDMAAIVRECAQLNSHRFRTIDFKLSKGK